MADDSSETQGIDEIIRDICISNGFPTSRLAGNVKSIKRLEMFFSGFPKIIGLDHFPHVTTLVIVGQDISEIEHLENCPELRELWVAECRLRSIQGLGSNKRISKLYLYDNLIEKIENISHLHILDVLWISKNRLKRIEGVENLKWLHELNAAGNQIDSIGHSLDTLGHLEILNLSGNLISSFKDITHLTKLPRLTDLSFKDPLYAPNPVCMLCNYSTHIFYHLPNLTRLDGLDVSHPQIKEMAEAIVGKKKMCYNMKVKVANRHLATLQNRLNKDRKLLLQVPDERLRTIYFALKSIELLQQSDNSSRPVTGKEKTEQDSEDDACCDNRQSEDANGGAGEGKVDDQEPKQAKAGEVEAKIEALKQRIALWKGKIEEIDAYHKQALHRLKSLVTVAVDRLIVELETGGNVYFQRGQPKDIWYSTCHDLVLSRFSLWDYKSYSVTGIKIHGITRVHNRLLRSRFDECVHEVVCDASGFITSRNYKTLVDYLFYVPDPMRSDDATYLERILEEGFRNELEPVVSLSNNLFACEKTRLDRCIYQAQGKRFVDSCSFRHGCIIIAKVFFGKSIPVQDDENVTEEKYYGMDSVYRLGSQCSHADVKHGDTRESNDRQCEWHVLNKDLVLPEYVIEFEYLHKQSPSPFLLANYVGPNRIVSAVFANSSVVYKSEVENDTLALDMVPVVQCRPRIVTLSEGLLLRMAQAKSALQVTILNLHDNGLTRLKGIATLSQLRHLVVSFNELTRLEDVAHMPNLEEIDASFNKINSLEGMRGMFRLKKLDLSWNQLTSLRDDITVMRKHCPALSNLDIRYNPWIKADNLFFRAVGRLKTLTRLNGNDVSESETGSILKLVSGTRISQAAILYHSRLEVGNPRSLSLNSRAQILHATSKLRPDVKEANWVSKIVALNLDCQFIGKLNNLDKLESLRFASFNKNNVTKLESLEACTALQELSLVDNCVYKLDGLSKLINLQRLDLSSNYLISLDNSGLEKLTSLHFLSVENNRLSSLKGLSNCYSLAELYLANNKIVNTREIFHLKHLSNLLILDLYGNLIVQSENYRLFVIYHVQSLKALDGIAVEPAEEITAKDAFGGRLTVDFVAEKLGHADFSDILELDLPSLSISTIDLGNGEAFKNLRSINVENNSLTSFSGLISLRHLKVLCLNHNHVECIIPKTKNLKQQQIRTQRFAMNHPYITNLLSPDRLSPIMESLEVLHLGYNRISSMVNLQISRLVSLKALFLQGNEIIKVEGLEGLRELRELVLDRNKIKVLSENSFNSQWNLQELHIEENRLRDLGNVHRLESLQRLYLGMNRIQDMTELEKMENLPNLTELSVIGNAVSRRLLHRPLLVFQQPNLQTIDGIKVTAEERTKAELYFMEQQPNSSSADTVLPGITPHNRAGPIKVTHLPLNSERPAVPYVRHCDDHEPKGVHFGGKMISSATKPLSSLYSQLTGVKHQKQNRKGAKLFQASTTNRSSAGNRRW